MLKLDKKYFMILLMFILSFVLTFPTLVLAEDCGFLGYKCWFKQLSVFGWSNEYSLLNCESSADKITCSIGDWMTTDSNFPVVKVNGQICSQYSGDLNCSVLASNIGITSCKIVGTVNVLDGTLGTVEMKGVYDTKYFQIGCAKGTIDYSNLIFTNKFDQTFQCVNAMSSCMDSAKWNNPTITFYKESMACTQDAKLCPDGSYVGRVPPDCEFAPCPDETCGNGIVDIGEDCETCPEDMPVGECDIIIIEDECNLWNPFTWLNCIWNPIKALIDWIMNLF